jgi:hypothetical protein
MDRPPYRFTPAVEGFDAFRAPDYPNSEVLWVRESFDTIRPKQRKTIVRVFERLFVTEF